jgi:hypothetical protein
MNERICWRTPASRGSNQSSPSNGTELHQALCGLSRTASAWQPDFRIL